MGNGAVSGVDNIDHRSLAQTKRKDINIQYTNMFAVVAVVVLVIVVVRFTIEMPRWRSSTATDWPKRIVRKCEVLRGRGVRFLVWLSRCSTELGCRFSIFSMVWCGLPLYIFVRWGTRRCGAVR